MKNKIATFLILTFLLGLAPLNFSQAITQNQINAEVQIVCPDNYGNWFSGSGTIIDSKGIILTNKHVVTDEKGGIIKACFVGFVESINAEPNFGTESNPNIAEVKYYTSTNDMDAAILYLDNKSNKVYPYIDIWNSDSNTLTFGDKLEVIGFPGIGGSTITYTSGDFSGFGSKGDGTQNYIKTTAPLEHGNSGGASYNPNTKFIGIPTMVVAGTLNSLSYILSVNSIKNWLSGVLGSGYQKQIIEQKPNIEVPKVNIQEDITPPDINKLKNKNTIFSAYGNNDGSGNINFDGFLSGQNIYQSSNFQYVQIYLDKEDLYYNFNINDLDESKVTNVYYTYSKKLSDLEKNLRRKVVLDYSNAKFPVTNLINLSEEGLYYIGLKFEDSFGNISNNFILAYSYEPSYKGLKRINYYTDSSLVKQLGEYSYNLNIQEKNYKWCATSLKNVFVKWNYSGGADKYMIKLFPAHMSGLLATDKDSRNYDLVTSDGYELSGLDKGRNYLGITKTEDFLCYNGDCSLRGVISSLLIKPYTSKELAFMEGSTNIVAFISYNPNFPFKFACGDSVFDSRKGYYVTNLEIVGDKSNYDENFINKLLGKILLQVESRGEAYYVYPKDNKRYYMANGNEAYRMMRYLGVGITNKDLEKVKTNKIFAKKQSGKIFLQVESLGEAYYIDFNGSAHYLKDGSAAYTIMRELGLGITNSDLSKIPEGSL